jgi:hypothetical protein
MNGVDATEVRSKVARAREGVRGRGARLLGFEAVEIQRFVASSTRPIAMQGACEALKGFDERNEARAETIFAGGARGLMLVPAEGMDARIAELRRDFAARTEGLSLAIADVPFDATDPEREAASLRWLWLAQRTAHDALPPERIDLAAFRGTACADCNARPGEVASPKPEAAPDEMVCRRCDALVKQGRKEQYAKMGRWTLEDVSQSEGGLVAVVSADGNRLGQFFRALGSLEALRAGSRLISGIFAAAHRAALDRAGNAKHIAPVTGGDDIKVFLPPTAALEYVGALMTGVEEHGRHAGDVGGILAGDPARRLADLGIGVGLLIAPFHVPAPRLVDLAHELEDEAKRRSAGRSAVCFTVQRNDGVQDERDHDTAGAERWPELVRQARLLRDMVPPGQRAAASAAWELQDAERDNQLLWQIARSREWKAWYQACGVDWGVRKSALRLLDTRGMFALAALGGR